MPPFPGNWFAPNGDDLELLYPGKALDLSEAIDRFEPIGERRAIHNKLARTFRDNHPQADGEYDTNRMAPSVRMACLRTELRISI